MTARVTKLHNENILTTDGGAARTTKLHNENIIGDAGGSARVTRLFNEIIHDGGAAAAAGRVRDFPFLFNIGKGLQR